MGHFLNVVPGPFSSVSYTEGHTKLLKGFKSKQGKSFDAVVAFDGEYNTTFVFPEAKKDKKFSGRKK